MMDKTSRLISVLRAESVDPQAKKTADFYRNEIQIREAIAAGWKLINIWKHLKDHNEFSGGYHSFLRYVKKCRLRRLCQLYDPAHRRRLMRKMRSV